METASNGHGANQEKTPFSWYLIHTKPRDEVRAKDNLENQGYTVFLPQIKREIMQRKKLLTRIEPLFPRYLFISLTASLEGISWAPIRSTKGVSKLVTFGDEPARVPDELVEALKYYGDEAEDKVQTFTPGERLRIIKGPFAGLEAVFEMHESQQRVMVLIDMLHQQSRMRIAEDALRRI